MLLRYSYDMHIDFSQPVSRHYYSLKCIPHDTACQKVHKSEILITPPNRELSYTDFWGGKVIYGCIAEPHSRFEVSLSGIMETGLAVHEEYDTDTDIYKVYSMYTEPGAEINAFYNKIVSDAPEKQYDRVLFFMSCVYHYIRYISGVTDIRTTAERSALKRCGVCQDFAHIMISLLRKDGIPARYAVGMMAGEGESHAWAEVNLRGYWYGFDPTNNLLVDDHYIKISHGRDYRDCIVSKGVFFGNARQEQKIKVLVEEV